MTALESLRSAVLYGILDMGYVPRERALAVLRAMLAGGVGVVQLRAKGWTRDELIDLGAEVVAACRDAGVPVVINDHPSLGAEIGADGVHVGQDDASVAAVRAVFPGFVGKSTHSLAQARGAVAEGADYIGFGPLFATATKPDYAPIGTGDIRTVHAEVEVPIFCIGGVNFATLPGVLAAGAKRVVVVSGILLAEDITAVCRELSRLIEGG